ncbi:MAG: hypothetical protein J6U20_02710 [Fibrobacter sp.]|nr:hypothetical protein [Fibrobacter sp.]
MKKIFLAALMAMSLCSYSYAQDDDDEYEEDSPRAVAESTTSSTSSSTTKAKKIEGGDAFLGVSLDLLGLLNNDLQRMGIVFKLAQNMELTVHFGLNIVGDTEGEDAQGNKRDADDGFTQVALGAGFDFFFDLALPASVGGDIIFTHIGEDDNQLNFDAMFGMRAEIIKNFTINGKVGLDLAYHWWTEGDIDISKLSVGIATRVNFIWFFI